jgi:hypothetical protein
MYPTVVTGTVVYFYRLGSILEDLNGWQSALLTFVLAAVLAYVWRSAREGIYYNEWGVRVQSVWGRTELAWGEIGRTVDAQPSGVIGFRTLDGRVVRSTVQWTGAITIGNTSPMLGRVAYDRTIAKLDEYRLTHS